MEAQQASANGFWQDYMTLANKAIHFDSKQGNNKTGYYDDCFYC